MEFIRKNKTWIGIGACALAILGCFLPFAKISLFGVSQSMKYIDWDGKFILIAAVISGVLMYLQNGKYEKYSLISSGIGLLITLYDASNVAKKFGEVSPIIEPKMQIGFVLILFGLTIAMIIPWIKKKD